MNLINQSCEAYIQEPGLNGIYKQIERAGRTCYKSSDKITEDSAKPFVERMIKSNHLAMLEHGTVYLKYSWFGIGCGTCGQIMPNKVLDKYCINPYSRVNYHGNDVYITTNLRAIIENHWEDDLKYLCEPTEFHEKRYTLHCTTALHCYKDLTRHRVMSFAIESTRFCNYGREKFGKELTFIIPTWCKYIKPGKGFWQDNLIFHTEDRDWNEPLNSDDVAEWHAEYGLIRTLDIIEHTYLAQIDHNWKAQQAAEILPQCVKGDMIITGFASDWKHLLDLRYAGTTGAPHPMVKELAALMKTELEKQGFIYEDKENKRSERA